MSKRGLKGSWNFFEAGHGKGAPDGIGASVKRLADKAVLHQHDVRDAEEFYTTLQPSSSVKIYKIPIQDIHDAEEELKDRSNSIVRIPGTMLLHQVTFNGDSDIGFRNVSCNCRENLTCMCYEKKTIKIIHDDSEEDAADDIEEDNQMIEEDFKNILSRWEAYSFGQIYRECLRLRGRLEDLEGVQQTSDGFECDLKSWKLLNMNTRKFPASVVGDGNCLPRSGSLLAFGEEEHPHEIRVRIIIELCLHKELYLDDDFLKLGFANETTIASLKHELANISPCATHGDVLTDAVIERIFENEVKHVTRDKTEMGVWQLFALASVLKAPTISIYPKGVKKMLLNRVIKPRSMKENASILTIMWTSTREDMQDDYWVPNHFIPVVQMLKHDLIKLKIHDHSIVDKWVAVQYDEKIYPGKVVKLNGNLVEVNAMENVGLNKFKWPTRPDQICYHPDDVLCMISTPNPINRRSRYVQICPITWNELNNELNKN